MNLEDSINDREIPPKQLLNVLLEHFNAGRYIESENLSKSLTVNFPKHSLGWKVLGAVLGQTGRIEDSLIIFQKTVKLFPKDAEVHTNLGNTLKLLRRYDEAELSYKEAIKLNSKYTPAHFHLGVIFTQLGRLTDAAESYKNAIKLKNNYVEAYYNLGITLKSLGKLIDARKSYEKAIQFNPNFAEAHYNLGNVFYELEEIDKALYSYTKAIELNPNFAKAHSNFGNALKKLGKFKEAKNSYKKATELEPNFAEAHFNLGITYIEFGKIEKATKHLIKAIELKSDYAEAHRNLTLVKKFKSKDDQYLKMNELYLKKEISDEDLCHINFALAKVHEDLENYEYAFKHYSEGNTLRKKQSKYNMNIDIEIFNQIKINYEKISIEAEKFNKVLNNHLPIFIVGMPRSGTTLIEQIISLHPSVKGAGELPYINNLGGSIARGLSNIDHQSLLTFRNSYLDKIHNIAEDHFFVTDKMPQNFLFLGLITSVIPEAKIIHVKRNPSAVCWANYKQYFKKDIGYSHSLEDIISYYKLYDNLMDYWSKLLNQKIYNIDYDKLTIDQEFETRRMIDYIGLKWDEKFLSPEVNKRIVSTASNVQIREKIYQGSSDQWKNYKPFLNGKFNLFD